MKKFIVIFILLLPSLAFGATVEESTVAYGGMKFNHEDAGYTGDISAASANTYYGFINASASENIAGMSFVDDDTNGDYLLISNAGVYLGFAGYALAEDTPSGETVQCAIFVNDTITDIIFQRVIAPGGDVGSTIGVPDIITLAVNDKVRIKCETSGEGKTVQISHMGFVLYRVFTTHTKINDPGTPCHGCL